MEIGQMQNLIFSFFFLFFIFYKNPSGFFLLFFLLLHFFVGYQVKSGLFVSLIRIGWLSA